MVLTREPTATATCCYPKGSVLTADHQPAGQAGADRTTQPDRVFARRKNEPRHVRRRRGIHPQVTETYPPPGALHFGGKTFTLEVETYSSPLEALEAARHDDYDLFISDYRMPVMDGIEFLKATKEIARCRAPDSLRLCRPERAGGPSMKSGSTASSANHGMTMS
jgi:CheY-like chemotaxis protein